MRLLIAILLVCCISCRDDNSKKSATQDRKSQDEVAVRSYEIVSDELFKNAKFNSWDTNAKPSKWEINNNFDIPEEYVIDRDTLDLMLKGDKQEKVYIEQKLSLEPNSYYVIEGDIQTRLKHSSYAGITLIKGNEVVGEKVFEKNTRRMYKLIFKTNEETNLSCYIGFVEEGEGEIMIKSISLKKVSLHMNEFESEVANLIHNSIDLDFNNAKNYDLNIKRIIKHISDLLLAEKRNDTIVINNKKRMLQTLNESSYLKRVLNEPKELATKSFTTKVVYSSNEILSEFNIGSRILEFKVNNKRVHLALMYHNPYLNDWVTIDPFYNSKIIVNSNFESITKDQVLYLELGGLITDDIPGLLKKYNTSKATVQREKILSHPF
ncbi:MAG: hypothetical protein ACPG58_03790 [Flavobacteriaceae bacterium]